MPAIITMDINIVNELKNNSNYLQIIVKLRTNIKYHFGRITMKAKIFIMLNIATCLLMLSACNTLHGLGKDIRIAGEQLESATAGD